MLKYGRCRTDTQTQTEKMNINIKEICEEPVSEV